MFYIVSRKHDVAKLNISVNYLLRVQIVKSKQALINKDFAEFLIDWDDIFIFRHVWCNQIRQCYSVYKFRHNVDEFIIIDNLVEINYIWVVKLQHHLEFRFNQFK